MTFPINSRLGRNNLIGCLVILGSFITPAFGQKFSMGVKGGLLGNKPALGDKSDRDYYKHKIKLGYQVGGFISFPLKGKYDCVVEGGYAQRGRIFQWGNGSFENNATYKFIDMALLLRREFKFNLGKNVPADWYFNVGPNISYWLSGKGTVGSTTNDGTKYTVAFDKPADLGDFNTIFLNDVNRWLFGANVGVGMHAPITKTQRVSIEARFMWGHTYYGERNSSSYSWVSFEDNLKANEKFLSITAAYTFDFDLQKAKAGRSTKDNEIKKKSGNKKKVKRRR
jgi:hypothetical protein